jgi:hypothetical protein
VDKYPDFSGGDAALYYLGQSLEHLKRGREAIPYYSHVITDFPLSPLVPQAKDRLVAMKQPVPRPTKAMLARAQADATHKVRRDWMSRMASMLSGAPDTSATLYGPVHIGPNSGIQTAKAPANAPGGGSSIVASPATENDLNPSKPAATTPAPAPAATTPAPAATTPAPATTPAANPSSSTTTTNPTDKSQTSTTNQNQTNSTTPATKQKKSRFHVLKKLDPF